MAYALYGLLVLLIAQGIFSLIEGVRFRQYFNRSLRAAPDSFAPRAAIIAPCKGLDIELEQNLEALFTLDYPDYEIAFAIASRDDSSRPVIERVMKAHPEVDSRIIVAPRSDCRGEKVNNLLFAVEQVAANARALAFVDLDARVRPDWLRSLVAKLADPRVGAATGYRWCLPVDGGFWSKLLSAWNGSVATTLGDHGRNFAWGGSTAILRDTYDRIGVRDRWNGAVSDDYALTCAVEQAGLQVVFEPACLVPSLTDVSFKSLIEFTTRQVIITRIYRPRVWWMGFVSHLLFNAGFWGGMIVLLNRLVTRGPFGLLGVALMLIYVLGSIKGWLRIASVSSVLSRVADGVNRLRWTFYLLWPLVSVVFLYNFIRSSTTREIVWRGVRYEMISSTETRVMR